MASPGEPRRITVAQAHELFAAGRAVIADVRDEKLYDNAHITGALSLPSRRLAGTRLPPGGGLLILYCA